MGTIPRPWPESQPGKPERRRSTGLGQIGPGLRAIL